MNCAIVWANIFDFKNAITIMVGEVIDYFISAHLLESIAGHPFIKIRLFEKRSLAKHIG